MGAFDLAGELRQLAELHRDGALDDAEFTSAKAAVLKRQAAASPSPPGGAPPGYSPPPHYGATVYYPGAQVRAATARTDTFASLAGAFALVAATSLVASRVLNVVHRYH